MLTEILEAAMLICFGLSWPTNALKSYHARTAAGTSWQFLALITVGYFAGIAAKFCSGTLSWVLIVYFLNLICLGVNWGVYFRNRALDAARINQAVVEDAIEAELTQTKAPKCVLFATDGSPCAADALEFAAAALDKSGVTDTTVLSVSVAGNELGERRARETSEEGAATLQRLGWSAKSKVRCGEPAAEIISEARDSDADLIVMGSRGLSGIKEIMLGSVGREVSEAASCPVLIVR